ncbi:membrane protein [Streptomyces sp. RSD-27]|nr:membrane protein [Streptomyces sp. RSD-27]
MKIDWAALGSVFGVSLSATVALVALFSLGLVGLSQHEAATEQGGTAALARSGAYACFALCAAAVAYGIYLIVS